MHNNLGLIAFIIGVAIVVFGLVFMVVTAFTGFHINTGGVDHTGYITSVEKSGVFFKTGTAYLKTSTQSTQEDAYCVIDPAVYTQLQDASVSGVHVNVHYHSWIAPAIWECSGNRDIIDSVVILTQ